MKISGSTSTLLLAVTLMVGCSNGESSTPSVESRCTSMEYDGYTYDLVAIGDQCWFAENLRNEHYANGDAISGNLSGNDWISASYGEGAQTIYGEGISEVGSGSEDEAANLAAYGRLYNWYAVDDARGLCPSGWHVPSDAEWMTLEMELYMTESAANSVGWRGTDQGTSGPSPGHPGDDARLRP